METTKPIKKTFKFILLLIKSFLYATLICACPLAIIFIIVNLTTGQPIHLALNEILFTLMVGLGISLCFTLIGTIGYIVKNSIKYIFGKFSSKRKRKEYAKKFMEHGRLLFLIFTSAILCPVFLILSFYLIKGFITGQPVNFSNIFFVFKISTYVLLLSMSIYVFLMLLDTIRKYIWKKVLQRFPKAKVVNLENVLEIVFRLFIVWFLYQLLSYLYIEYLAG